MYFYIQTRLASGFTTLLSYVHLNTILCPPEQFSIEGYTEPIRLDRNRNGGGLVFFIRDDLPCKELKSHELPKDVEGIFIEIRIRNNKWLIMGGYNPHKEKISYFLNSVEKKLDKLLPSYDNM